MKVTILRIEGCPNWELARDRVEAAAARTGVDVDLEIRAVVSDDDAVGLGFTGSPTILVSGANPFGGDVTGDLACRLYDTELGSEGAPAQAQIEAALLREANA